MTAQSCPQEFCAVSTSAYILGGISSVYFNTQTKVCSLLLVVVRRTTRGLADWTYVESIQAEDMSQRTGR